MGPRSGFARWPRTDRSPFGKTPQPTPAGRRGRSRPPRHRRGSTASVSAAPDDSPATPPPQQHDGDTDRRIFHGGDATVDPQTTPAGRATLRSRRAFPAPAASDGAARAAPLQQFSQGSLTPARVEAPEKSAPEARALGSTSGSYKPRFTAWAVSALPWSAWPNRASSLAVRPSTTFPPTRCSNRPTGATRRAI